MKVAADELAASAQVADQTADRLVDRYQRVAVEVQQLLDGQWSGAAADACRAAWDEWSDGFRLTVMGLRDESTALLLAAHQYSTGDSAAAAAIDDVTIEQ